MKEKILLETMIYSDEEEDAEENKEDQYDSPSSDQESDEEQDIKGPDGLIYPLSSDTDEEANPFVPRTKLHAYK